VTDSSVLKDQKVRQFQKGILELAILKIISEKECYGYHIVESLKQYRIAISEGTIYPLLSRLKDEEVITYRWEGSSMGPPRKYYLITDKGRELLALLIGEWRSITRGLEDILRE